MACYEFSHDNVDAVLQSMLQDIHNHAVRDGLITVRNVHLADRRLDYVIAYWKRKNALLRFQFFGNFADCHVLIPEPIVLPASPLKMTPIEPSREGVMAAFAKGIDPRTWVVPEPAPRFHEALRQWKMCVWAGNAQEQMKQVVTFYWALCSPPPDQPAPERPGKCVARRSRKS